MRLELQFNLSKPEISLDYRKIIISFLKFSLEHYDDGRFFDKFYKDRDCINKDYTFSVLFQKPKFTKEKILLEDKKIKVIFSCNDTNRHSLIFLPAFLSVENRRFPLANGNYMILNKVTPKREKLIKEDIAYFQTMLGSSLCIREHDKETNRDRFVTCGDKDFKEKAESNIKYQLELAGFSKSKIEKLSFDLIQGKKLVVYHYGIYIDTTIGVFRIQADSEVLQYLYAAGAGSKHAAGFGAVSVIDMIDREELTIE